MARENLQVGTPPKLTAAIGRVITEAVKAGDEPRLVYRLDTDAEGRVTLAAQLVDKTGAPCSALFREDVDR